MLSSSPTMDEIMAAKCEDITPLWETTRQEIEQSTHAFMKDVLRAHDSSVEGHATWTDCEKTVRRKRLIIQWFVATGRVS